MASLPGLVVPQWIVAQVSQPTGGGSQTPALVALLLAVVSGFATLYSIWRQSRADRTSNMAVHSTAANEASKLSFEQTMAHLKWQAEYIEILQGTEATCREQIEKLEAQVEKLERQLAVEIRESAKLRREADNSG